MYNNRDPEKLISVVIPAYNYAGTLERAAVSVIMQLDEVSELIIIDDGSLDETPAVMRQLEDRYPGKFLGVRKPNGGPASARNRGISESSGKFLIFLDADDEMAPGALSAVQGHIESYPETDLIICGSEAVFPDGHRRSRLPKELPQLPLDRVKEYLITQNLTIANGACAISRDIFELGLYPESLRIAEDIPVFAQALASCVCTICPVCVAFIYRHEDSLRHNKDYNYEVGEKLVSEIFDGERLPKEMRVLRKPFIVKRYLTLFREAAKSGDRGRAWGFYIKAIRLDWRAVFRLAYTRKLLMLFRVAHE